MLAIVDVESGALSVAGELASVDGALHSFPRWSPNGSALVVSMDRFDGDEFLGGAVAGSRRTDGGWSAPEPVTEVVAGPWVDWHPTAGGALLARRRQPAPPAAAPGVLSRARRGGALPSAGRRHHPWS